MDRLYQMAVDTPAGTPIEQPQSTPFTLEDAELTAVTILIADGHSGLTGIRILQAQQEIIPWANDDWLVSNNEVITVSVNTEVTISGLVIQTYNLDAFDHKHWVRATITSLGSSTATPAPFITPIPSSVLSGP